METGRLFWQAAGRSEEDDEVWCSFQQDDQGGGDYGDSAVDHGDGAELCAGINEQASAGLGQEESMGAMHAGAGSKVVFKSFRSCKETQADCFRSHLM